MLMHSQCSAAGAPLLACNRRFALEAPKRRWRWKETSGRSRSSSSLSVRLCPLCCQGEGADDSSSGSTREVVLSTVAKLGVFSLVSGAAIKYSSASVLQAVTQASPPSTPLTVALVCLPTLVLGSYLTWDMLNNDS